MAYITGVVTGLSVRNTSAETSNSTRMIGINHHFLLCRRKSVSSRNRPAGLHPWLVERIAPPGPWGMVRGARLCLYPSHVNISPRCTPLAPNSRVATRRNRAWLFLLVAPCSRARSVHLAYQNIHVRRVYILRLTAGDHCIAFPSAAVRRRSISAITSSAMAAAIRWLPASDT